MAFDSNIKQALQAAIAPIVAGKAEIGLDDLRRLLDYEMPREPLTQDGRLVAKMLNALGWRRDGWLGTGYDRQARYVPVEDVRDA